MARVTSLLVCLALLLASVALVNAGRGKKSKGGYEYQAPQKVIILPAGPSATYPWVGHCPPKGKCKNIPLVKRPPFPSLLPPAPPLPYYAPAQYVPQQQVAYAAAAPVPYQAAPYQAAPAAPYSAPAYSAPAPAPYSAPTATYSAPDPYAASAPAPAQASYSGPEQSHHHSAPAADQFVPVAAPELSAYGGSAAAVADVVAVAPPSSSFDSSQEVSVASAPVEQPSSSYSGGGDLSIAPYSAAPDQTQYSEPVAVEQAPTPDAPSWIDSSYGASSPVEQSAPVEVVAIAETAAGSSSDEVKTTADVVAIADSSSSSVAHAGGDYHTEGGFVPSSLDVIQQGSPFETESYQLDLSIQQAAEAGAYSENTNYGTRISPRGARKPIRQP